MPQSPGHGITVAGGAGERVGDPTGAEEYTTAGDQPPIRPDAADGAILHQDGARSLLSLLHPRALHGAAQGLDHIGRAVRDRKDPVAPLHFQRAAVRLKKRHGVLRRKTENAAV